MPSVYLASPLGFSPEKRPYLDKIKQALVSQGVTVFCPWEQTTFNDAIDQSHTIADHDQRVETFWQIASGIGEINENGIRSCDVLLAVLDGAEVDSGTASELGFASALGKTCYGLRTDKRNCGDFVGLPINLQLMRWIERSGGRLFRSIEEIRI